MPSRTLPGLELTGFWDLGGGGWKPGMDANLQALSALVQCAVLSRTDALPGGPTDGDMYIVPTGGEADNIAIRDDGAWVYFEPKRGWIVHVLDDDEFVFYDGSNWAPLPYATTLAGLADVDLTTVPPEDGEALVWDETEGKWVPGPASPETLGDIGDVDLSTPPEDGETLIWDEGSSTWIPGAGGGGGGSVAELGDIGDVDLTTPPADGETLVWDDGTDTWVPGSGFGGGTIFAVSFSTTGTPEASELLAKFLSPGAFFLPVGLTGSMAHAGTAPGTGSVAFDIKKNGSSIGTMSVALGATTATFTFASAVSFVAGDRLEIFAPSLVHGIEDVAVTFLGELL